jgi:hypothetical protein
MVVDNDNKELNELLASSDSKRVRNRLLKAAHGGYPQSAEEAPDFEVREAGSLVQWTTGDNKRFIPASHTSPRLVPGVYEIQQSPNIGIYFEKIPVKTEGLLRFPQTNSDKVVTEIQKFWEKEAIFREYKLYYKRGIILWGPPGSGKSCTIQLIMKDVVERDGVVIKFTHPGVFLEGMRIFREIEKETPAVVLMEDIDSTLERYSESDVLNILDGVDAVEKVVFLATTNYPQNLGARILNRPSRFDKRFKIDHPNAQSRRMYFEHLIGGAEKIKELKIDLKKWVKDSEKFSIAHLKELFVAVVILGDDYDQAIETLRSMKEFIHSDDDKDRYMGFGNCRNEEDYGCDSCG